MLFLAVIGTVVKCSNDKIERLENNIGAYKNKMELVETQNGELMAVRQSLMLTEAELREELDISKKELKDLKKTLADDIAYIAQLESMVAVPDTVYVQGDTVYISGVDTVKTFKWQDKWMGLSANVVVNYVSDAELNIYDIFMDVPLEFGLTDGYKVFVKSSNPYVKFDEINSVVVDGSSVKKKQKRWHHGITAGFGVHYGLVHSNWDFGPGVMYGVTYSF
jgi:hypothetical protein